VGNDPAEALRRRTKLMQADSAEDVPAAPATKGTPLPQALEKYLSDLEALNPCRSIVSTTAPSAEAAIPIGISLISILLFILFPPFWFLC
jgi:hypothetical protein